ncbi:MAG TPA: DUF4159 domain-containing protein, partial [Gemmatimonadaceae bacterium]|nr:DUF4159 domain-containing protein [Gemmatimonadaceae bacterium]
MSTTRVRLANRRLLVRGLLLGAATCWAAAAQAQRGRGRGSPAGQTADCGAVNRNGRAYGGGEPVIRNIPYDGRFTFVRLTYVPGPGGYYYQREPSWAHGYWENYPEEAEINLMEIMREVSIFHPHVLQTNAIAMDDPELFKYPVAYMTEAGYWEITNRETLALRKYLLKGGFLIIDDSRADYNRGKNGWATLTNDVTRLFPALHPVKLDNTHP